MKAAAMSMNSESAGFFDKDRISSIAEIGWTIPRLDIAQFTVNKTCNGTRTAESF